MGLTILAAPPGTDLNGIIDDLTAATQIVHADVEKTLIAEPGLWDDALIRRYSRHDMASVVAAFPRDTTIKLWRSALVKALDSIQSQGLSLPSASRDAVLSCHLSLYSKRRSEFFLPLDPTVFRKQKQKVDNVILLIDDIYDMYARLAQHVDGRSPVFGQDAIWNLFLNERTLRTLSPQAQDGLGADAADTARLRLEAKVLVLSQLLSWRRADMVTAETISSQLDARLVILGTKHPRQHLIDLVHKSSRAALKVCYVSHPISRPRRNANEQRTAGSGVVWDPIAKACNALPGQLRPLNLLAIMPTAIDELRFSSSQQSLYDKAAALMPRWPLATPVQDLMYEPTDGGPDHNDILAPDANGLQGCPIVGSIVRGLETTVWSEVPFRDHALVAHSDALLILFPLYEDGTFSTGVRDEISHWHESVSVSAAGPGAAPGDRTRRAAFVHSVEDIGTLLTAAEKRPENTRRDLENAARTYLMDRRYTTDQIDSLLAGDSPQSSLLDQSGSLIDPVSTLDGALDFATNLFLWNKLTSLGEISELAAVFVVDDTELSERVLRPVGQFLQGSPANDLPPFRERLAKIIGGTFADWARRQLGLC